MSQAPKAIFCWSGGKDSAYCLHKVLREKTYNVKYLLTTLNENFKRISMHGVREDMLDAQTEAIGIPLLKVWISAGTNTDYETQMEATLLKAKAEGITHVIFGDIFLEDLRTYRETNLAKVGMQAVFPLWKTDTTFLINDFIKQGFKTITCCINDGYLGEEWVGKEINNSFIKELPAKVDPCGENGEYHTFCYDGPLFKKKVEFTGGEKVYKTLEIKTDDVCSLPTKVTTKGFWYYDILPLMIIYKYKHHIIYILLFTLSYLYTKAQDTVYARKVINTLCSKQFAGRGYVNNGLGIAAKYIAGELKHFKTEPLFNTGYFQWFDMNVNTFPGKMSVKINGKTLKPGIDFIVSDESSGLKGKFSLQKKDSVTYIGSNKEGMLALIVKRKLTFSVSTNAADYCAIELLNNNTDIKTAEVNIENKLLTKYICKNICGYINGTTLNNDTVLMLTAHYDHLGMMGNKTYFPGANDNASGVSMLLNLVKYYSTHPPKYKTIFVFFAGEEAGLLGSKYFVEHPVFELGKIKFLINLDLLGTGDEGITVVNATEFKSRFDALKQLNENKHYLALVKPRSKAQNSDHYWFTEKGVPSFFIYTMGGIKAYHDVYDKPQTLPLTKYNNIFKLLVDFLNTF